MKKVVLSNDKQTELIHWLKTQMNHPFVEQYVEKPMIDIDKIHFLWQLLARHCENESRIKTILFSTMFVQVALDTHERVSLGEMVDENKRKNRQLTVLSGDYYSSLYYYLLSENNELPVVRLLAKAIEMMNESKMTIYLRSEKKIDAIYSHFMIIQSQLLQELALFFDEQNDGQFAQEFFFVKKYFEEENQWLQGENPSPFFNALLTQQFSKRELKKRATDANVVKKQNEALILMGRNRVKDAFTTIKKCMNQSSDLKACFEKKIIDLEEIASR